MIEKILENKSAYKSVLCLDGNLQCDLIKKIDLPVIAVDGAANVLIKNGIEPEMIVGDLDSVDNELLHNRRHLKINSQDNTDFEKALDFVEEKSMTPSVIMGINGGCLDHILGNISIFSRTKSVAVLDGMFFMAVDNYKILHIPANTKISIFGMPGCLITSKGLKWELQNHYLSIAGKNSQSNRTVSSQVELKVSIGKALVFVYTELVLDAGSVS
ncbi:MAG: thiamine diphosphokinase [Holosporaceae bacterium]|jgi:thiamine pyrophosphokinase|nr:thiamine diphosphokinase [Holosporaceae bacterium]